MRRQRNQLVGAFLILGAAIGFTVGIVTSDLAAAATFGAAGAGLGVVMGAIVDLVRDREPQEGER